MTGLTSQSFAARTCCSSPDCGWCVPALWQCRPAVRRLWRAARSCHARLPAALTGTVRTNTVKRSLIKSQYGAVEYVDMNE